MMIRKLFKVLTSRALWMIVLFGIQLALIVILVIYRSISDEIFFYSFSALSIVIAVIIMSRNEKAPYKLVWMFMLVIFPFFGGVFYLLFANKKIGRLSSKKVESFKKQISDSSNFVGNANEELYKKYSSYKRESLYVTKTTDLNVWGNTRVKYFAEGQDFFPDVLEEVKKAEKFIFIEYFIIDEGKWWSRILDVLVEKAQAGVDVRVIYDDMGSIHVLPVGYDFKLKSLGLKAICFNRIRLSLNPRLNFRDHRKIFCIDGNVCYTGGLNLADEYSNDVIKCGYWKDCAIKMEGPAVWNMTLLFLRMWNCLSFKKDDLSQFVPTVSYESDGYIQPFGDNPFTDNSVTENAYLQLINNADKYVWIATPYLIPDDLIRDALITAAKAGIDVRIITPHYPDKKSIFEVTRSNYQSLVEAGVRIYEFIPGFIHSKTFIVDDEICCIGTNNIDYRSLYLHFELSVMLYGCSVIKDIKKDFEKTLELSQEQTLQSVMKVSFGKKLLRFFLKLFSPAL